MYEENVLKAKESSLINDARPIQEQHIEEATKMAHHIMQQYGLQAQNEVIKTLGNVIMTERRIQAEGMQKEAERLSKEACGILESIELLKE